MKSKTYPISDHFDGKEFFNPWSGPQNKTLWELLKWQATAVKRPWPDEPVANTGVAQLVTAGNAASTHVTFISHATVYIQDGVQNILTDPHFSERASPVSFAGPKRIRQPGLTIAELPAVDVVVISHNHYDHLDIASLKELESRFRPQFIVPLGNAELLQKIGLSRVTELDWWQSYGSVQLVPAQHWSARGIWDRNQSLWGGYMITLKEHRIFFAGDTGYGPHFEEIKRRSGPIDLSLLPIGAYEPRWFMGYSHMNPADAVLAHRDLGTRLSVGIHFETFRLTDEGFSDPRQDLATALTQHQIPSSDFIVPEFGGTIVLK